MIAQTSTRVTEITPGVAGTLVNVSKVLIQGLLIVQVCLTAVSLR